MASATRQRLQVRARYLNRARHYFSAHDVLEVETPVLGNHAVTDPHVDCITAGDNQFLRPSPEYALKCLLARGSGDIYEIGKVFRDGEAGSRHHPEFTMVEWYRVGFDLQAMIDDTVNFILTVTAGGPHPPAKVQQFQYASLFVDVTGLEPLSATVKDLATYADRRLGEQLSPQLASALGNDKQAWLDLLMTHCIEPGLQQLGADKLSVITHYPASQALLARLSHQHPGTAERFEVYYRGYELANGFYELNDADEQRRRFQLDQHRRAERNRSVPAIDETFMRALEQGLPECSGVAVGLDRLIMSCEALPHIGDVLALSTSPAG